MSEDYRPEESLQEELTGEEKAKRQTISFQMLQGKPYVTWILIGFTAVVYFAQAISKWQYGTDVVMFYGAKISAYILKRICVIEPCRKIGVISRQY